MSQIALISDQHFDRSSRWEEHLRIMEWIARDMAARRPSTILLGGDLFERRPTPEEMNAAVDWVRALANVADVVGIYGNHEPEGSLYPLTRLETEHPVTIYSEPAVHRAAWGAIACLPWPRRAHLLASLGDVTSETANQVAVVALQNLLRGLGNQAEEAAEGGARVLLAHCQIRGARLSSGQPLAPGADFEIGLDDLSLARADAYLFGHIHRRTEIGEWAINGAPALYAGSPRRTAYGEIETKSYALCDVASRPVSVDLVATPCREMVLLTGRWNGEYLEVDQDLPTGPADVRLRVEVSSDQRDAARAAAADVERDLTGRGCAVKVEEKVIATVRARAPEVAKGRTTEEQLTAMWATKRPELDEERRGRLFGKLSTIRQEH